MGDEQLTLLIIVIIIHWNRLPIFRLRAVVNLKVFVEILRSLSVITWRIVPPRLSVWVDSTQKNVYQSLD